MKLTASIKVDGITFVKRAVRELFENNKFKDDVPEEYRKGAYEFGQALIETLDKYDKEGWIPCSERLPEGPEENPMFEGAKVELYLVSCGDEFYPFRAFWNGKDFTDGLCKVDAEAWMPLPEPYKKGDKEWQDLT